ncbi:MAG: SGNH/GDSL hydrolase family protein [Roseburia sp.]|nr:SGNH/GDSL hydrolase family protein [Roseburia sp.]MCM1242099.1 SGNH/GDSL hydrolase family protein [Roseburia sp.]
MDNKKNKKGQGIQFDGRITVLTIMIGFCILAIIEIAFGRARLKTERERLALEEQNYLAMQAAELEKEVVQEPENGTEPAQSETGAADGNEMTNTSYVPDEQTADTQIVDTASDTQQAQAAEDTKEYDMQLVFLGDSILDNDRGDDNVADLVARACNAKVYNLAIGGTTAALKPTDQYDFENWDSLSLLGVANAIVGNIDRSIFSKYKAGELMEACDFSKTDYFIIEYGINDFMAQYPPSKYLENGGELNLQNYYTYSGAIATAINILHSAYPNAMILVIAPHYCQIFSGETFIGDGYSLDYGYGPLINYMRACGYVAEQNRENNVIFFNAFEESGIDAYTADKYLEDGIHLTSEGRWQYAECVARLIMADFRREE